MTQEPVARRMIRLGLLSLALAFVCFLGGSMLAFGVPGNPMQLNRMSRTELLLIEHVAPLLIYGSMPLGIMGCGLLLTGLVRGDRMA